MKKLIEFEDIEVTLSDDRLVLSNAAMVRELDLSMGAPRTVSLRDAAGREFAAADKDAADLSFAGLNLPGNPDTPWEITGVKADLLPASIFDGARVRVTVEMLEKVEHAGYYREYFIYPGLPVIAVQNSLRTPVLPNLYWSPRGNLVKSDETRFSAQALESCADGLKLADGLQADRTVEFVGRTDYTDELVFDRPAGEQEKLNGNLLFCNDGTGAGLFFLQEAPPSGERRDYEAYDFRVSNGTVFSCNWGIHATDIHPEVDYQGYRHVLALYHSEAERDMVLKRYLKTRFPINPDKNYSVMVNPWGCGKFPSLVSEEFLIEEIKAAAEVGATHYQIDDAWQTGKSLSELCIKNRCITPEFWTISEGLHHSFDRIIETAKAARIEPGLWMAPSCNCEYRDWRVFSDIVLDFYRNNGFKMFKIDAVKIRTHEAERNLRAMLQRVREESNGEIYFNLDTTNGQRPGYFMFLEYGNIFLENRYVCHMWGEGYHPEKTLRSLWRLSRFVRPQSLQIEIPYPGDINPEFYRNKPWVDPKAYPSEYWAAIAMFANPLLWMAPSTVAAEDRPGFKAMMELHRLHRDRIFAGEIFAVGAEPDGKSMTGFHSHRAEDRSGDVIFYREYGCKAAEAEIAMNYLPEGAHWVPVGGEGTVENAGPGKVKVTIPAAPGYVMYRYEVE